VVSAIKSESLNVNLQKKAIKTLKTVTLIFLNTITAFCSHEMVILVKHYYDFEINSIFRQFQALVLKITNVYDKFTAIKPRKKCKNEFLGEPTMASYSIFRGLKFVKKNFTRNL
jgi:hypothetical protein